MDVDRAAREQEVLRRRQDISTLKTVTGGDRLIQIAKHSAEGSWMNRSYQRKTETMGFGDFLVTFWSLKKSHAAGTVDQQKFEE